MELQLLPSHKIDKTKWDECLYKSPNNLIYAGSVYLDHMADNWDAIVGDDYNLIMPIPWHKKYGIKYCYSVPFIQQLGVFGKSLDEIENCYRLLHESFKYGDYAFNYMNAVTNGRPHTNYTLSLASNYRSTASFYSSKLQADVSKATSNKLEYVNAGAGEVITLFRRLYAEKIRSVSAADYKNFHTLSLLKEKENNVVARKIISGKKELAMVLFLKDKLRLYNLMSVTTPEGRSLFAGHALYDNVIKEFSQTGLVLDFEGSELAGVQHFYKSFGAIPQPYTKIHLNRLPLLLKLFKR
jgi:hypothetical protein